MIYITGDTHGDLTRVEEFILKFGCTKDDIIAIMGEFMSVVIIVPIPIL